MAIQMRSMKAQIHTRKFADESSWSVIEDLQKEFNRSLQSFVSNYAVARSTELAR